MGIYVYTVKVQSAVVAHESLVTVVLSPKLECKVVVRSKILCHYIVVTCHLCLGVTGPPGLAE